MSIERTEKESVMSDPYRHNQPIYTQPVPSGPQNGKSGKGFLITTAVLVVIGVALVFVGASFGYSQIANSDLFRSIAIDSARPVADVPGQLQFRIVEPLSETDSASMRVGIGLPVDRDQFATCSMFTLAGDEVTMSRPSTGDAFTDFDEFSSQQLNDWVVIQVATLSPGDYSVRCDIEEAVAEEFDAADEFYVGRVFGNDEAMELIGPIFVLLGTWGIAFILGILALIFLIVGLVRRSRHNKSTTPPFPPQGPGPQGPQGPYPPQGPGPQDPYGYDPEGQYPPQSQYPPSGQQPPPGQYPPQGQYPPTGNYPPSQPPQQGGQYSQPSQAPLYAPQDQYQPQGQYPPFDPANPQIVSQPPPPSPPAPPTQPPAPDSGLYPDTSAPTAPPHSAPDDDTLPNRESWRDQPGDGWTTLPRK